MKYCITLDNEIDNDYRKYVIYLPKNSFIEDVTTDITVNLNKETNWWVLSDSYKCDECEGCEIDAPGQDSHMNCPDGCLHTAGDGGCGECDELPTHLSYLHEKNGSIQNTN